MGTWSLPHHLLLFGTVQFSAGLERRSGIIAPLKELLQREEQDWLSRHGNVKDWEKVARSFSMLEVFKKGISAKDIKNQLSFLVWKLERASDSDSSKPARPTAIKRPFTLAENVEVLAWAVGLDVLPLELSKFNRESTDPLDLWETSIDLAKVSETLSVSSLWREKDTIPIKEVKEALDVVLGVLQSTTVKRLQTPATARKRRSHGSLSRGPSRQRFENDAEDPSTQLPPEFSKEQQAVERRTDTLQRKDEAPCDACIERKTSGSIDSMEKLV